MPKKRQGKDEPCLTMWLFHHKIGLNRLELWVLNRKKMAKKKKKSVKKKQSVAEDKSVVLGKALGEMDKLSSRKLAKVLGVSRMTAWRILQNQEGEWDDFYQKRKRLLDSASVVVMEKLLSVIESGRLSPSQAGVVFGILSDKVYSPQTTPILNQIRVGEKIIKVYYPNFKPPEESDQS